MYTNKSHMGHAIRKVMKKHFYTRFFADFSELAKKRMKFTKDQSQEKEKKKYNVFYKRALVSKI